MGKFDGVLLISDFDDTLLRTSASVRSGQALPEIPAYNLERIRYFMDQGGRFALASGRVWVSFVHFLPMVPTNAPCGTANGAAIVDPKTGENLFLHPLPDSIGEVIAELERRHPAYACELYPADNTSDVIRPNDFTRNHAASSRYTFREITDVSQPRPPFLKALFEGEYAELEALRQYIVAQPWYSGYEVFFSSDTLLELIARGADKGTMVPKLAELCGVSMDHTYCIGDNANDMPMLEQAKIAFAPSNAVPAIHESGAVILCDCMDGAVGQAIDYLDRLY